MNKAAIIILLALATVPSFGQERTLISGPVVHGGFGGPHLMLGRIKGETAVLTGGWGGWLINHTLMVGGGGYGLVNDLAAGQTETGEDRYLNFGYGGMILGFILGSDRLVHVTAHTLFGLGDVGYRHHRLTEESWEEDTIHDVIFVIQPTLGVELNVTRFFRIAAGGSYRHVAGTDMVDITDGDLGGFGAELTLKFGKF
ncbi:MAG: hypothetical protein JSU77_12265 [Fidelibacterota bacterium]|nr:MAG: hypothetical protein JSU77_12265 [Candidatus Neomarinimicrobiota bacterium]